MKQFIISVFVLLLFFLQQLQAQDSYEDVVYLKNGSVFRGMIVEQVPGKSITIESADKEDFTFTYEEIEKIRKELRQSVTVAPKDTWYVSPPTVNTLQVGMLTGRPQSVATFSLTHGVQVNEHLGLGLGIGWDAYTDVTMIPIFLDMRDIIASGQASPFIFIDAGYSVGKLNGRQQWNAGGFVLNAGFGFIFYSSTAMSFTMNASYHLQRSIAVESPYAYGPFAYGYFQPSEDVRVNREFVMITFGLGF